MPTSLAAISWRVADGIPRATIPASQNSETKLSAHVLVDCHLASIRGAGFVAEMEDQFHGGAMGQATGRLIEKLSPVTISNRDHLFSGIINFAPVVPRTITTA